MALLVRLPYRTHAAKTPCFSEGIQRHPVAKPRSQARALQVLNSGRKKRGKSLKSLSGLTVCPVVEKYVQDSLQVPTLSDCRPRDGFARYPGNLSRCLQ